MRRFQSSQGHKTSSIRNSFAAGMDLSQWGVSAPLDPAFYHPVTSSVETVTFHALVTLVVQLYCGHIRQWVHDE